MTENLRASKIAIYSIKFYLILSFALLLLGIFWQGYPYLRSWLWVGFGPSLHVMFFKYSSFGDLSFWLGNFFQGLSLYLVHLFRFGLKARLYFFVFIFIVIWILNGIVALLLASAGAA